MVSRASDVVSSLVKLFLHSKLIELLLLHSLVGITVANGNATKLEREQEDLKLIQGFSLGLFISSDFFKSSDLFKSSDFFKPEFKIIYLIDPCSFS